MMKRPRPSRNGPTSISDLPDDMIRTIAYCGVLSNQEIINFALTCSFIHDALCSGHGCVSMIDPHEDDHLAARAAGRKGRNHLLRVVLESRKARQCCLDALWIETTEHAVTDTIKLLLSDSRIDPTVEDNVAMRMACGRGQADVVELLLRDQRSDPSADDNANIWRSSLEGHGDVVKLLLADPRVDPSGTPAITSASYNGHDYVVQLLLADPRVDPSYDNDGPLWLACSKGHAGVVRQLLAAGVDPSSNDNQVIATASGEGYTDVVKLLLADPRVDPNARENWGIRTAIERGHREVVELLVADPRLDPEMRANAVTQLADIASIGAQDDI